MESSHSLNTIDKLLQQAYERQLELMLQAEQECQAFRDKFLAGQFKKIDQQFKQLARVQLLQQRILRSNIKHHYRMLKINKKYQLCEAIFEQVEQQLHSFCRSEGKEDDYKVFLLASIVQGLIRMFQDKIQIRCLQRDVPILQELIPLSEQTYKYYMKLQIGRQYQVQIKIARNMQLQPKDTKMNRPMEKQEEERMCIGGVILSDQTGNISFKATLDCRLSILKELCLPDIRALIWQSAKAQNKLDQ